MRCPRYSTRVILCTLLSNIHLFKKRFDNNYKIMRLIHCFVMAITVSAVVSIDLLQVPACLSGSLMSCAGLGATLIMPAINMHSWHDETT
ncbi:unnamed protein product [Rotaria magnacalcarata]|uniref:Uncharacterized protein n=1 Tax=Rotaria magnacalcarata TaxID=392030 RepID=A0A8S2PSK8_9BILA|nr:unnamed protein product [Rotaria magnacalcarata]CAF4063503.1 unnamed protein product [Rotaria magnacalcarata]CAF4867841.1 unnamed protein product [Rotaria magnacalcarata]